MNHSTPLAFDKLSFSIDHMYPEINVVSAAERVTTEALAYYELGYQLELNLLNFLKEKELHFYRLAEIILYSGFKCTFAQNPHQEWQRITLDLSIQCFERVVHHPSIGYMALFNAGVMKLIQAPTPAERQQQLDSIRQYVAALPQEQTVEQRVYMHHSLEHLSVLDLQQPIGTQVSKPILLTPPMYSLYPIRISAQQRAEAMALRWQLLPGLETSPLRLDVPRPDYSQITWRQPLIQWLWEAEYPQPTHNPVRLGTDPHFKVIWTDSRWACSQVDKEPHAEFDVIALWDLATIENDRILNLLPKLQAGGMLIVAVPRSNHDPEVVRQQMESLTHSTCYLIDRESTCDVLIAYVFKDQWFQPTLRVLILMRPDSVSNFGGADLQMMRSRAYLKQHHIRSDISLALRLDEAHYDLIYVVGYWHDQYKLRWLEQLSLPKVCMLIMTAFNKSMVQWYEFYATIKPYLKPAKGAQLLQQWETQVKALLGPDHPPVPPIDVNNYEYKICVQLAQLCDFFIFQSEAEAPLLWPQKERAEMPYQVIPNGCYADQIQQASASLFESTYHLTDFVLCIGRFDGNKNQAILCDVLRDTGIPLVLIGKDAEQTGRVRLCRLLNPAVHILENLTTEMLHSALKAARLLVVPSGTEVSPLVTLEAAWARCPIVLTRYTLQAEWFGDACYVCDPLDPAQLKAVILQAWNSDNQEKIEKAWQRVQICTWEKMAQQLSQVFDKCRHVSHIPNRKWWKNQWYELCTEFRDRSADTWPLFFDLPDNTPLLDLPEPERHRLNQRGALVTAVSGLEEGHLCKQGFTSVLRRPFPIPEEWKTYIPSPMHLDDLQDYNFLCIYDPQNQTGWRESLQAFLALFQSTDAVSLVIYSSPQVDLEQLEHDCLGIMEAGGYNPEQTPTLIVLAEPFSQFELFHLLATVQALLLPLHHLGSWQLWLEMAALTAVHVVTHDFGIGSERSAFSPLLTLEEMLRLPWNANLPVDIQRLQVVMGALAKGKA